MQLSDNVTALLISWSNGNQVALDQLTPYGSPASAGSNGTYVSVESFHLFRYLDEQTYRYNNRKLTDGERFSLAVSGIVGKRVTFDELTGKTAQA